MLQCHCFLRSYKPVFRTLVVRSPITAIFWNQGSSDQQDHIHHPPNTHSSQSQQLAHCRPCVSQAESVHTQEAQQDRIEQCGNKIMPRVPGREQIQLSWMRNLWFSLSVIPIPWTLKINWKRLECLGVTIWRKWPKGKFILFQVRKGSSFLESTTLYGRSSPSGKLKCQVAHPLMRDKKNPDSSGT